jgi:UDP-N-acetylmuramate--alanine ligase
MNISPLSIGTIHLIGIGGIGMSGIAEILHSLGHKVQGSDMGENTNTDRLKKLGISVFLGHTASNLENVSIIVPSSAVKPSNPELVAAKEMGIPVIPRSEMLAELMRFKATISVAGTHGKTTTTSLVGTLLEAGNLDPTIINGGIINSLNTNAKIGDGNWMVVEADESDGTFIKLPSTIAIITNIDPEHMEHFGTFENLTRSFLQFAQQIPFYGFSVLCVDHPVVRSLIPHITNRRYITYGIENEANCMASNIRALPTGTHFDLIYKERTLKDLHLSLHGTHNILNCLAAIIVALELDISEKIIRQALSEFQGVKRRFTQTGVVQGITIIDDYGHHPTEIAAVLKAVRAVTKKQVIAVVQPHRFSRVKDLFPEFSRCFQDADQIIIAPIYAAGESPIEGVTHKALEQAIKQHFKGSVYTIENPSELPRLIHKIASPGDYVICLGAGTISEWANKLPENLQTLYEKN